MLNRQCRALPGSKFEMMNKKLVILLVAVMTAILAGLVSIQFYWIRNALALREQQFDQNVTEALNLVAKNLERQDAASFLFNDFFSGIAHDKNFERKIQLLQSRLNQTLDPHPDLLFESRSSAFWVALEHASHNESGLQIIPDSSVVIVDTAPKGSYSGTISIQVADSVCKIHLSARSKEQLLRSVNEQIQKLNQRKSLINDIFFQFFSNDRSIHERIPADKMEEIIRDALNNEGIDAPFEYLVTNQFGTRIAASRNFETSRIQDAHRVVLFPNDLFSEPNYLLVQFPSKQKYILRSLGVMSLSSIGLILAVSLGFAYTIFVILQQKKLSDMKTDFVNNMTHELKTPISTISLASEMLRDSRISEDPRKIQKYAAVIHEENKRLGAHVEKVLQMAVLDRGELKLKKSKLNIHNLIQKAIDKMALQMEERNGILHTQLQASYPEVSVDETHFINIITNLLDNAIKYSSGKPEILIATHDTDGGVIILVSDKGIGMSRDVQKKVFDKFYRVPTGNVHNVKGFGLGLSYVKAMVDAHGGTIRLKSEPQKGTTFEIFIPHAEA
ncbi:MAG: two-component sensor histidine kinase [Chitinophagales bacterium]|nr:MAG: two-component sensor histidine kinase [Chitinophagales bacterium]